MYMEVNTTYIQDLSKIPNNLQKKLQETSSLLLQWRTLKELYIPNNEE